MKIQCCRCLFFNAIKEKGKIDDEEEVICAAHGSNYGCFNGRLRAEGE